ncbi:MAG: GGDEF domain-containing protein [Polyangiaceae bacterium]
MELPRPSSPGPSLSGRDFSGEEITGVAPITQASVVIPQAVARAGRALVLLLTGTSAGQVFALEKGETLVGRGRDAHVYIDDTGISRGHCRICCTAPGASVLEDLSSRNGTFVNGKRVARATLEEGDRIQVGPKVVLRFAILDETEEALARSLFEASTRDPLTRAFNRRYFMERLDAEVAFATRHDSNLSVVMLDLDHFKHLNDTFGHAGGDAVLRGIATQIPRLIRAEDVFARYGGEEFVLLVRGIDHPHVALLAERIQRTVHKLDIPFEAKLVTVTLSAGVASISELRTKAVAENCPSTPAQRLLGLADARLYSAKSTGRNRVCSA